MSEPVLSLAEIGELERAYALGAPALGRASVALLARWRLPLRDDETFLRLAFLSWYREHEPEWLTGLTAELPTVDALVADRGGEDALTAEARFALTVPGSTWSASCTPGTRAGGRWARTSCTRSGSGSGRASRPAAPPNVTSQSTQPARAPRPVGSSVAGCATEPGR